MSDSPLTPTGEARFYAVSHEPLDPAIPLIRIIEQAWLAGYSYRDKEASFGPPTVIPKTDDPRLGAPPPQSYYVEGEPGLQRIIGQPDPSLRPLLHKHGDKPCHRPAMYLTRMLSYGEPPDLALLRLLPDMRQPTPIDPPICGSCGIAIDPYTQRDLDWAPHFERGPAPLNPYAPTPPPLSHPFSHLQRSEPEDDPPVVSTVSPEVGLASDAIPDAPGVMADEPYPSDADPPAPTLGDEMLRTLEDQVRSVYQPAPLPSALPPFMQQSTRAEASP